MNNRNSIIFAYFLCVHQRVETINNETVLFEFMFIIGFTEFFAQHRYIVGVNNMYFPSATVEMIGYLTLTLVASFALRLIEKLMDGSDSYELAQGDQLVMAAGTYSHPDRGTPFDEVNREYTGEEKRNRIRIGLKNRNGSMRGGR